jgi:pimeloyl-ACP methyl ester carboxylesterase
MRDVLLLHSGIGDPRQWQPQLERWSDRFRLRAPDLWTETGELLDAPAAVVGSSFGGRVALELAATRPELVRALVLVASALPGFDHGPELAAVDAREEELYEAGELEAAADLMVATWMPGACEAVRAYVKEAQLRAYRLDPEQRGPLELRLAEIRAPALLVDGELDRPEFHAIADRLERELPDVRGRVAIPGAHHLPNLERPDAFDDAVLPFLDSLP